MGMSTDMAPTYISMNPTGQMTYILDTSNINLARIQLAAPGSEIVLIQEENKAIGLCESPVQITDATTENVAWLGNNVIVLVSQPQEFIVVEQEVVVDSNAVLHSAPVEVASNSLTQLITNENSEEYSAEVIEEASTIEDAKSWYRDSLITTAALSKLTNYVQSNGNSNSKIG